MLGCCHCHHQGQGHCPCGTHLLSQFPIWDRDTAPSTVPCLCLCRLFGNLFSQIPSLSLILSTGRLVGGSSAPARLENPMGGGLCPPSWELSSQLLCMVPAMKSLLQDILDVEGSHGSKSLHKSGVMSLGAGNPVPALTWGAHGSWESTWGCTTALQAPGAVCTALQALPSPL